MYTSMVLQLALRFDARHPEEQCILVKYLRTKIWSYYTFYIIVLTYNLVSHILISKARIPCSLANCAYGPSECNRLSGWPISTFPPRSKTTTLFIPRERIYLYIIGYIFKNIRITPRSLKISTYILEYHCILLIVANVDTMIIFLAFLDSYCNYESI